MKTLLLRDDESLKYDEVCENINKNLTLLGDSNVMLLITKLNIF